MFIFLSFLGLEILLALLWFRGHIINLILSSPLPLLRSLPSHLVALGSLLNSWLSSIEPGLVTWLVLLSGRLFYLRTSRSDRHLHLSLPRLRLVSPLISVPLWLRVALAMREFHEYLQPWRAPPLARNRPRSSGSGLLPRWWWPLAVPSPCAPYQLAQHPEPSTSLHHAY